MSFDQDKYKHQEITGNVIGAAMEVHKLLGNGFQEKIYQKALAEEFTLKGLNFKSELTMPIYYKDKLLGSRRVDFLVEDVVLVELKALSALEDVHYNQILNYIVAYKLEVGLLINFGNKSLQYKRFVYTNHPYKRS